MKIETYYPDIETSEKLNKLFSLPYNCQDWEIVNADDEKVDKFTEYYLGATEVQEKVSMFALLVASIDMLEEEREIEDALNRIKKKMKENVNYHLNTIIYWALIGHGKDKKHIFKITKYMRNFLSEIMNVDKFKIVNPSVKGIIINGINLPNFLKESQISKPFTELIDYLNKETASEDASLEISESVTVSTEKERDFTHFEFWSSKIGLNYLKVETDKFEKEIKKYVI